MADIPIFQEVVRQLVGQLLSVSTIQIHLFRVTGPNVANWNAKKTWISYN